MPLAQQKPNKNDREQENTYTEAKANTAADYVSRLRLNRCSLLGYRRATMWASGRLVACHTVALAAVDQCHFHYSWIALPELARAGQLACANKDM